LINHRLDYRTEPISAFDYRTGPITLTASLTAITSDCYRIVYRSYRGMVNTNYRATFGPQSATISSRRIRCYRQHSLPQSRPAISLPRLLPATHRRHRYGQRHEWHDHYRQRFAATAIGKPPPLPATPRPLPATLRRHRYR
jgi:hypothetical protein